MSVAARSAAVVKRNRSSPGYRWMPAGQCLVAMIGILAAERIDEFGMRYGLPLGDWLNCGCGI